jgi:Uncharacterized protein, similar to the N-terminal domain of Lon protease
MMRVGNRIYAKPEDLPARIPVFPLAGALLLPGSQLPLNIFEPRYLAMIDDALAAERVVGIIQPTVDTPTACPSPVKDLCCIGCVGRIVAFGETGDGRYLVTLGGVCRFRVTGEIADPARLYRVCTIEPDAADLSCTDKGDAVDRAALLESFRSYLEANNLEADWASIEKASNAMLVNSLSMMSPYGPAEKQALLEARDYRARAETLIAITEMILARRADDAQWRLQ